MPDIVGRQFHRSGDDRLYVAFELGAIEHVGTVRYHVVAQDDQETLCTKPYSFDLLDVEGLGELQDLIEGDHGTYAVFKRLTICFDWSHGLCIRTLPPSFDLEGKKIDTFSRELADGLSLHIARIPFSWQLKRFTNILVDVQHESFQLFVDKGGHVHRLAYSPRISGEHMVGFGERFDSVEQRGKQLLCRVVEKYTQQGEHSYLPIPFFMTSGGVGWYCNTQKRLWFDAREGLTLSLDTNREGPLLEEWWLAGEPQTMLADLHRLSGNASLPPKWAFGIWISANGWNTQQETLEQLAALEQYKLPATALVLEAWSDEETFCIFNDAKYDPLIQGEPYVYSDFRFSKDGKWPDPKAMADAVSEAGINLILWQIPVIKYTENAGEQLLDDEAYALAQGYCVMNDDGTPYRITDNWFGNSLLLDFTNPEAVKWWFGKRAYLVETLNVKGFKTDGGEFLFDDSTLLSNGQRGETAHNTYPGQYVEAYYDFMREQGIHGVTFSRAGYSGAQKHPIHWAGDQLSEWSELRAQLTAGLSAGLSGIPFWSFDIGGFAGDFPSPELYLRATAMAAFSPVMQWHSEPRDGQFYYTERARWNNDRSPWNLASVHDDPNIINVYRRFANLRMTLLPYIYSEAMNSVSTSRPLMAHLLVDWPLDRLAWTVHDQYMLGRNILVAPVIHEGDGNREIYLPDGTWHDLFWGGVLSGGTSLEYACALDALPVFVRDGSAIAINLNEAAIMGTSDVSGGLANDVTSYKQLAFLCFGAASGTFQDDQGNNLNVVDGRVYGIGDIEEVLLIEVCKPGHDVHLFNRGCSARKVRVERYE
jgi:alpha-glucosidase (family GH31 glycosyl hydrolase)